MAYVLSEEAPTKDDIIIDLSVGQLSPKSF